MFCVKLIEIILLCVVSAYSKDLYEGEDCVKEDSKGTCIVLGHCPSAVDDVQHKKTPQLCSFNGSIPVVCCVNIRNPTTFQPPSMTPPKDLLGQEDPCDPIPLNWTTPKIGQVSWDKCIDYQEKLVFPCAEGVSTGGHRLRQNRCHRGASELIVGETTTGTYEYSHMVRLGTMKDDGSISWLRNCEGALINENFVLTSAHCLTKREGTVSHVLLGVESHTTNIIKNIIPHPDYKSLIRSNDIALVKLQDPVKLDQFKVPACLPVGDMEYKNAMKVGWTLRDDSEVLQKIRLTKVPVSECTRSLPPRLMKKGLNGSQECYVDRTFSRCEDTNGILHIENRRIRCMHTVVGVGSFAPRGCTEPGIYTSVAAYLPWIESVAWASGAKV